MKLKFYVYCPDDEEVIKQIIRESSTLGAGVYGKYSQVAFLTHGEGNWEPEEGAKPYLGEVGQITRAPVVRIEMTCDKKQADKIVEAIKEVHPWEEVDIEFVPLVNL